MVISDLNYLQAADLNIVGGGRRGASFSIFAQVNYSDVDVKSITAAKTFKGGAVATSSNAVVVDQCNRN